MKGPRGIRGGGGVVAAWLVGIVGLLAAPPLTTASMLTRTFVEVSGTTFTAGLGACVLKSMEFAEPSVIRCGGVCNSDPYCTLFCLAGSRCETFRAKVTSNWAGAGNGAHFIYDRCWSSHPKSGDISMGLATAAPSVYNGKDHTHPVNLNYFCSLDTEPGCYEGQIDSPPWWRVDLGQPTAIKEVRINQYALLNSDVEFRLGNDTTAANNPLFVSSPEYTPYNGLLLAPPQPRHGRYFFVTEPGRSDIRVCDVWIIKA